MGETAVSLQADWKNAKTHFQTSTGKKKPDSGFFSHAAGIDGALGKFDQAMGSKDYKAAKMALDAFDKAAAAYSHELTGVAGKAANGKDYNERVKELELTLQGIVTKAGVAYKNAAADYTAEFTRAGRTAADALAHADAGLKLMTEAVQVLEGVVAAGPTSPKFLASAPAVAAAMQKIEAVYPQLTGPLIAAQNGIDHVCKAAGVAAPPKELGDYLGKIKAHLTSADQLRKKGHDMRAELDRLHVGHTSSLQEWKTKLLNSFHLITVEAKTALVDFPKTAGKTVAELRPGKSAIPQLNYTYKAEAELKTLKEISGKLDKYKADAVSWRDLKAKHDKLVASVPSAVKDQLIKHDPEVVKAAQAYEASWAGVDLEAGAKELDALQAALEKVRKESEAEDKDHKANAAADERKEAIIEKMNKNIETYIKAKSAWPTMKKQVTGLDVKLSDLYLTQSFSDLLDDIRGINSSTFQGAFGSKEMKALIAKWQTTNQTTHGRCMKYISEIEPVMKAKAGDPKAAGTLKSAVDWLRGIVKTLEETQF